MRQRLGACAAVAALASLAPVQTGDPWVSTFPVDVHALATSGENPLFILKPGYRLVLEGRESGKPVRLAITVLDETVDVSGVPTRVVEERETAGGVLVEVSRNFYAIDPRTKDVYYFGEDVDTFEDGHLAGHEGAWRHGSGNARFGLMMPGAPALGQRYYQEYAPGVAMDRAEVVSLSDRLTTPAGAFDRCLRTRETTPLERGAEYKRYAPGVGLIEDGPLRLVSYGYQPLNRTGLTHRRSKH
jgi:hypothetical protein